MIFLFYVSHPNFFSEIFVKNWVDMNWNLEWLRSGPIIEGALYKFYKNWLQCQKWQNLTQDIKTTIKQNLTCMKKTQYGFVQLVVDDPVERKE